jgi:hypothetical protein
MNQHTYLRAYMAGIVVPTIFLLGAATAFTVTRYIYNVPVPVERIVIFPMAVVPNLWGVWNILFIATHTRTRLSAGLHGMILPFILIPLGILLVRVIDIPASLYVGVLPLVGPVALITYYLAWKYFVGSLNEILGIAA